MEERLTKKEKRELRRLEWQEKIQQQERSQMMRKYVLWGGLALGFLVILIFLIKLASSGPSTNSSEPLANFPKVEAGETFYGSESAKVTLVEYSDFQCPACETYYPTLKQLKEDYKDRMLFVYRNFPLRQAHANAAISAQASYAAHKQGKFWEMHNLLFDNQSVWSNQANPAGTFEEYASTIELDVEKFQQDMNSQEAKDYVSSQEKQALSLGVNSTPTFFLNKKLLRVNANYEEFKKAIDQELSKN
ncbi:MAG: thioredoxin domain-containing protein [Patescibacteria group bacterium]